MLIISTVIACSILWAIIASVMAYNNGREIHIMAERHNSVVNALRKTEVELEALRFRKAEAAQRHTDERNANLSALERIDQLTADKEQFQMLYIESANKLKRFDRPRDPKTGRIVSKTKLLCDEVKANAVNDIDPQTESALNMATESKPHTLKQGMTVKNPTDDEAKEIFAEARRVGLPTFGEAIDNYPWIWFAHTGMISRCAATKRDYDIFITSKEFIERMNGI